jgi:uncharacterized protein (DUF1778 family)
MPAIKALKSHPIAMRLPTSDVAIIDHAAGIRGRSRTDFMREASVRAAEEVILDNHVIRMSTEAFAEFMDVVSRPAKPIPELLELYKRSAPWETQQAEAK